MEDFWFSNTNEYAYGAGSLPLTEQPTEATNYCSESSYNNNDISNAQLLERDHICHQQQNQIGKETKHYRFHWNSLLEPQNAVDIKEFVQQYQIAPEALAIITKQSENEAEIFAKLQLLVLEKSFSTKFLASDYANSIRNAKLLTEASGNFATMLANGWQMTSIIYWIEQIPAEYFEHLARAIEVIAKYKISVEAHNRHYLSAPDIISIYHPDDWYVELIRLAIDSNESEYAQPKDQTRLIKEILELNSNNSMIKEPFENGYITSLLTNIENIFHKDSVLHPSGKAIEFWEDKDILNWKNALNPQQVKDNIAEVLAVIKKALKISYNITPRDIQIISTLLLYQADKGRLAEVATGEGKTIIVAMFATLKALEGNVVDIVTSSSELAIREAKKSPELISFYSMFGLTVGENISGDHEKTLPCYQMHIVYGDALSFIGDIIRDETSDKNVRGKRPLQVVIIDEADSAFIDQSSYIPMLTHSMPGFEFLHPIFINLWQDLHLINNQLYLTEDKQWVYIEREIQHENKDLPKGNNKIHLVPNNDKIAFIRQILTNCAQDLVTKPQNFFIPQHLQNYAKSQVENWVNSALMVYFNKIKDKVHYEIIKDKDKIDKVAPVEYQTTGVSKENTHWPDGLHQFLQIKHGLKLTAETLVTSFMSAMAYFKKYGTNIYGLTGTLGAAAEQSLLNEIYGVDFAFIPTYQPKKLIELPPVLASSHDIWLQKMISSIRSEAGKGRAVLVIAETIEEAYDIYAELIVRDPTAQIKLYVSSGQSIDGKVNAGDIIIATNIAGRGTDIKTSDTVEENGGLHVCVSYLPSNLRVQLQAYGRTAREGKSGTVQMIIDQDKEVAKLNNLYPWFEGENLDELIQWRDLAESERLMRDRVLNMEKAKFRDELFTQFVELIKELKSNPKYKTKYQYGQQSEFFSRYEIMQVEELWGMWLKDQESLTEFEFDQVIDENYKAQILGHNNQTKQRILANFKNFKDYINKEFLAHNIMKNPGYMVQKGADFRSIPDLNRALESDKVYSYAANYVKSSLLIRNQEISDAHHHLQLARHKIENFIIPELREMQAAYCIFNVSKNGDALSKQILFKISLFNKNIDYIDKALTVLNSSAPGSEFGIGVEIRVKDVMGNDTNSSVEIAEFISLGVGLFFEVNSYIPDKDDDGLFGSIFAFVLGIGQIVAGIAITAATGGFAFNFGVSMIIEGALDIVSSIQSVITGKGINIESYFNAKLISYGVNSLIAGISSIQTALAKTATTEVAKEGVTRTFLEATLKSGESKFISEAVKHELIKQGTIKAVGYVADLALGHVLDDHQQEIEAKVKAKIEKMLADHQEALQQIIAADKLDFGTPRQSELRKQAMQLLKKYEKQYHTIVLEIIKGTAQKYHDPIVSTGAKILDLSFGLDQILSATEEFCNSFSQDLVNAAARAPSPDIRMEKILSRKEFSTEEAREIVAIMVSNQRIVNHKLESNGCAGVENIKLQKDFDTEKRYTILAYCEVIQNTVHGKHQDEVKGLHLSLTDLLTHSIMRMIHRELINPVSSIAGSIGANKLLEGMARAEEAALKELSMPQSDQHADNDNEIPQKPQPSNDNQPKQEQKKHLAPNKQKQINQLATDLGKSKGGIVEAQVLARTLKQSISLYKDGKLVAGFEPDSKHSPIKANYDSTSGGWGIVGSTGKYNSIYEAVASQGNYKANLLRQQSSDYVLTHPALANELLFLYKSDASASLTNFFPADDKQAAQSKVWKYQLLSPPKPSPESQPANIPQQQHLSTDNLYLKGKLIYKARTENIVSTVPAADKAKLEELVKQIATVHDIILERDLPPLSGEKPRNLYTNEVNNARAVAHAMAKAAEHYIAFSQEYPNLAEYGLSLLNIGVQTALGGVVGLVNGIKTEVTGLALGKALEEYTNAAFDKLITETCSVTKLKYPELNDQEARTLAAGIVIGAAALTAGTFAIKHVIKHIDDIQLGKFDTSHHHPASAEPHNVETPHKVEVSLASYKETVYKLADELNLSHHEGGLHKGHTIEKHVGKSQEWLKDRLVNDPRITGSTSFPDLETANKHTRATLKHNADKIAEWLNSPDPRQNFIAEFSESIGHGFNKNGEYFKAINKVNVVLTKDKNGFVVLTAHPLVDKVK